MRFLLLLLHNALFPFALLGMAPAALKKMKARGGKTRDLWQRFGFFKAAQVRQLNQMRARGPVLWMHAASVGEVGIAVKLIRQMLKLQPNAQVALTTTTPTGFAQAQAMKEAQAGAVLPLYSALDGWFIVRRFLKAIRPQQLILVEAEVWPNLTFACHRAGLPVFLINARLSPRSERRYKKFLPLSRAVFSMLHRVMVQEPEDVARWTGLGVAEGQISHTGSVKFDTGGGSVSEAQLEPLRGLLDALGWQRSDPVMLLASTHAGEEVALTKVYAQLRESHPALKLVIVPRHVERAAELAEELQAAGWPCARRSSVDPQVSPSLPEGQAQRDVLLVDTTGELRAWQHLASAVVVGKSFLATGGQNPAEAIMAGKPVLFGPHMENFAALVDCLLQHDGALRCADLEALRCDLENLLSRPEQARKLAVNGLKALKPHEGATLRTARLLGESLAENKNG